MTCEAEDQVDSLGERSVAEGLVDPRSLIHPVRAGNTLEATFEGLLRLIKVGAVLPGQRLPPERELADSLQVSRSTLRSVLGDLQRHGYLEVRRGRYGGTFVIDSAPEKQTDVTVDPRQLQDILAYRTVVESGATRLAAEADLQAPQRRGLRRALDAASAAAPEEYRHLDSRLHIVIAELTGSRRLVDCVVESRALVNDLLDRIPLLASNLEHSNHQHQELVAAILDGDPETAESVARAHLDGTETLLRSFLNLTA